MRLRSIPPRTCITIARKSLRRRERASIGLLGFAHQQLTRPLLSTNAWPISVLRGKMRQLVSRKPFEEKLAKWQEELEELSQWADEGLDVSKIKKSIEERIEGLLDLLEGKNPIKRSESC